MEGGRLFVDDDGAYWKEGTTGNIVKVQFANWRWKGEPPPQDEILMPSRDELVASIMKRRDVRKSKKRI